jgi:hypothetical protein
MHYHLLGLGTFHELVPHPFGPTKFVTKFVTKSRK